MNRMDKCKHENIVKEVKTYYKKHADMMICGYDEYEEDKMMNFTDEIWRYKCLSCGQTLNQREVRIV